MHISLDLFVLKLVKFNDVCRVIIKKIKQISFLFREKSFHFFFSFVEESFFSMEDLVLANLDSVSKIH
jgi:hypothetical protein